MKRGKKKQPEPESRQTKKYMHPKNMKIIKRDMPIRAPVMTYNFGDLLRFFKYYMGAGMIFATLERMVSDAREDIEGTNLGTFIKFAGLGIMFFMIFIGAYILLSSPNIGVPNIDLTGAAQTLRG